MNKSLEIEQYYNEGNNLLLKGDLSKAVLKLQKLLFLQPDHYRGRFKLGLALAKQEKYLQAESVFRTAIALIPENSFAYYCYGLTLSRQEKMEKAEEAFRKSILLNCYDYNSYNNLGEILTQKGEYSEAILQYKRAQMLSPNDQSYNGLGYLYFLQGEYDDAIMSFNKALKIDFSFSMAYFNKCMVLVCIGQIEEGKESFKKGSEYIWLSKNCRKEFESCLKIYQKERVRVGKVREEVGFKEKGLIERNLKGFDFVIKLLEKELETVGC